MHSKAFENVVIPAFQAIIEGEAVYRCERDLHHHLTAMFEARFRDHGISLDLGSVNSRIKYEHPTKGKYRWLQSDGDGKSGNVDIYFSPTQPEECWSGSLGIAVEVNYNYDDVSKITRDIFKLIDPDNGYVEPVYVACARKPGFHDRIINGAAQAIEWVRASLPDFTLPENLFVFAMSEFGGSRDWRFYGPSDDLNHPLNILDGEIVHVKGPISACSGDFIDRETARMRLQQAMKMAGISLDTITAKCMFEPTTNRNGKPICALGPTPLWDRVLPLVGETVLDSIFDEWIGRLVASGRSRQGA